MKALKICPLCSAPGIEVSRETFEAWVPAENQKIISGKEIFQLCTNYQCNASYYFGNEYINVGDLGKLLWFKDTGLDVPICYCSNLSRGKIMEAVRNGCNTISEVREYTGKNTVDKCLTRNPAGKCCSTVFLYTIKEARLTK